LGSCEEGEGEKEGSREGGAVEGEEERTLVGWVEEGRESWDGGREDPWLEDEEEWPKLGGPGCLARAPGGKAMLEGRASGAGARGRGVRGAERDALVLDVDSSCSDTFLKADAEVKPWPSCWSS